MNKTRPSLLSRRPSTAAMPRAKTHQHLATAGIVMTIAFTTISLRVIRVALSNPVNMLKNE